MSRSLPKSRIWFNRREFVASSVGGAEILAMVEVRGWKLAGRVELTNFVDGGAQFRFPLKDGEGRAVRTIRMTAEDMKK